MMGLDWRYQIGMIIGLILLGSVIIMLVVGVVYIFLPSPYDRKILRAKLLSRRYDNYEFNEIGMRIVFHLRMSKKSMDIFEELGASEEQLGHYYRMIMKVKDDKGVLKLWRRHVFLSGFTARQRAVGVLLLLSVVPINSREFWGLNREKVLKVHLLNRVPLEMIPYVLRNDIDLDLMDALTA